jgi:hypothetical protein
MKCLNDSINVRCNLLLVAQTRSLNKQSFYIDDNLRVRIIRNTVYVALIVCIPINLYVLRILFIQGENKIFPWLQIFITRKLLFVEYKHFV